MTLLPNAKIDILLPFWGDVKLLHEAVDSVITQTNPHWRLTIIDDCYPSEEPKARYGKHPDPRITYIRNKANQGITKNFNIALKHASAEFCVIMGCDDVLLPNYVDRALTTIRSADFYQPGVQVINENSRQYLPLVDRVKQFLKPKKGLISGEKLATSLSNGNWLYFPSLTFRTAVVQQYPFNEDYRIVEDVDQQFRMIMDGRVLFVDDVETFCYRRSAQSLSSKEASKQGVRFAEEKAIYQEFSRRFNEIGWHKAARAAKYHLTSRIHRTLPKIH